MCLVIDKIIYKPQNGFVWGRQILDSILVANEYAYSYLRDDIMETFCKLDTEKASIMCARIFFYVLRRCGFGEK